MILNASPCEDIGLYGTATREMIFFFPLPSEIRFVLHKKEEELLSHHADNQSEEKGDLLRKLGKEMLNEVKLKSHNFSCLKRVFRVLK